MPKKHTMRVRPAKMPRLHSFNKHLRPKDQSQMMFDLNGRKAAYGAGILTGMIIVAAPHLIGCALLLSILVIVLKLVEKDRL